MRGRFFRWALPFVLLAGCETVIVPVEGLSPDVAGAGASVDAPFLQSTRSKEMAAYYQRVEQDLLTKGLLRQDGGGADVPFTREDLVENFVRIALFEEYTTVQGRIVARQTPSVLHRWEQPVRLAVHFGASVPEAQRLRDRADIGRFVARLSRITGLDMRLVRNNANFDVYIVSEDERRALGPEVEGIFPGIGRAALSAVTDMDRSTFCLVFASDADEPGKYSQAVSVIRAEHPDLLRLSCIHEEIAQGLGLSNDSPRARPSIFNDDEEFALLTYQDELLLRILYDPRMNPGMDPETARRVAAEIAAELMPDPPAKDQTKEAI